MMIEQQLDGNLKRSVFKSIKEKQITLDEAIEIIKIAIPKYKHKAVKIAKKCFNGGPMRSKDILNSIMGR